VLDPSCGRGGLMKRIVERWRRRLCQQCQDRRARYSRRGRVRRRRDHDLCFRCYRSLLASVRRVPPRRVVAEGEISREDH